MKNEEVIGLGYLPSMTLDELERYLNDADTKTADERSKVAQKVDSMLTMSYDDEFKFDSPLIPYSNSKISDLFKTTKLTQPSTESDIKVKATANDLKILLNQTTFGNTGAWLRLVHSGFAVKLKPIDANTRINLQAAIAGGVIGFFRHFTGDIYTSVYIHAVREIVNLFISLIDYSTFSVPAKKDIRKFIKVKDLNLIKIALLKLMYPNGYDGFRYICGHAINNPIQTIVDGETITKIDTRVCGRESEPITMNLDELVYIQDDFTEEQIIQLNNTQKNSLTDTQVLKYQEEFKYNQATTTVVDESLGLSISADSGNVFNYLNKSTKWLEEVLLKKNIEYDDVTALADVINTTSVGKYFYAISRIEGPMHYADADAINVESVLTLSSNPTLASKVIDVAKENIANSAYVVAIPKYKCPVCTENQKLKDAENPEVVEDDETKNPNDELITNINVLDLFTYLA
jgi:hypothetical protein